MPDRPATQADLKNLESRLEKRFGAFEHRVDDRIDALEQRMDAFSQRIEGRMDVQEQRILERVGSMIHECETRLLQAFYGYAEATNKRLNQIDGNMAVFFNRLGTMENRLLEVERRLNIPPAAP